MSLKIDNAIDATNTMMSDGTNAETAISKKQDSLLKGGYTGSLNGLYTAGWYWCNFSNVTGSPYTSGYGWVEVIRHLAVNSQACVQKIYRFSSGITEIAIRPYTNNQWWGWRKVATTTI
ncbi:MAG: hypothetical protein HFF02_06845 [Erysipelotrichaceae bacterium]|nr:hypothetical protein [Erysipelotrichaceae bacterium]